MVLREIIKRKIWIWTAKKIIRQVMQMCAKYLRCGGKIGKTQTDRIIDDRVGEAAIFEVTRIDLAEHMILKYNQKIKKNLLVRSWTVTALLFSC